LPAFIFISAYQINGSDDILAVSVGLDGLLPGDAAVRRGLQALLGSPGKITKDQTRQWLAAFSPWRALIAVHLWSL
jgi:3-methyladenine DNA glycosylase/8-oxoguanine DNA glycosylase